MINTSGQPQKKGSGRAVLRTWNHFQLIVLLLSISFVLTVFIGVLLYSFVALGIPEISSLESYQPPETSVILDSRGEVIDQIYAQNRFVVPVERMPPLVAQAFVAAEDSRFYQHQGVDGWSVLRAVIANLRSGERSQGGSTITQQVARSLLLTREKTFTRKIKEAILAWRIDRLLSKDEILHIYLNEIYLGEGAYGVEAASRTYFGKRVDQLGPAEISVLAGLPQAPSRYSPLKNYDQAKHRQAYVLNRMAADGYITPTMARKAYLQPLGLLAPQSLPDPDHQYFLQSVRNYVVNRYGRERLLAGGLTIHTAMVPDLQKTAAAAVRQGVTAWKGRHAGQKEAPQAALVAIDVTHGRVLAIAGGTDFEESQFNRAVQARRQPGSAFKPFVYLAAFETGLTPASLVVDEPIRLPGGAAGKVWEPKNFDGRFVGPVTLRDALVESRNTIAVKLLRQVGLDRVVLMARKMGITSPLAHNLSLALGASEVTLLELTAAYGVLARQGSFLMPLLVTGIADNDGKVLEQAQPKGKQVIDPRRAYQLTDLLEKVVSEGTGRAARGLSVASAGKTGTTDQNMDAWFVGYTPEVVAGVWVGFDQKKSLGKNETGGRAAAPIWKKFMETAAATMGQKKMKFAVPTGVVLAPINRKTGQPGRMGETDVGWEVFSSRPEPDAAGALPEGNEGGLGGSF